MSSLTRTTVGAPAAPANDTARRGDEADAPLPMAEIDLLPSWYPALVRRRRWITAQVWATGALLVVLTTVLVLRREDLAATHSELATIEDRRRETDVTLGELSQQQARLSRLTERARAAAQVGLPLEVARVLSEVARETPTQVALTEVTVKTEEPPGDKPKDPIAAAAMRSMRFTFKGIAPDVRQAMDMHTDLGQNPLFRNVRLLGTKEGASFNRSVTAFEITFVVDLSNADDAFADVSGGRP